MFKKSKMTKHQFKNDLNKIPNPNFMIQLRKNAEIRRNLTTRSLENNDNNSKLKKSTSSGEENTAVPWCRRTLIARESYSRRFKKSSKNSRNDRFHSTRVNNRKRPLSISENNDGQSGYKIPKASISCSSLTKSSHLPNPLNTSCTDLPLDQIVSGPADVPCSEIFNQSVGQMTNTISAPDSSKSNKIVVEFNNLLQSPGEGGGTGGGGAGTDSLAFNSNENSNEKAAITLMSDVIQKSKLITQKSGGSNVSNCNTANSQSETTRDSGLLTTTVNGSNVFLTATNNMVTTTSPEMITTAGDPNANINNNNDNNLLAENHLVGKKLTEIQMKLAENNQNDENLIVNSTTGNLMTETSQNLDSDKSGLSDSEYETCNISSAGFLATNSSSNEKFDQEDYELFARKSRTDVDLTQIGFVNHVNTPVWPSLEVFQQSGYCRFKTEHHQMLMRSVNPNKLRSISSRIRRQQMQCLDTSLNQNQHLRILAKVQNDIEKRQRIEKKSREARKKGERNLFLDELNHVLNIQYKNYAHCLMESNLIKKPKKEPRVTSSSKNKITEEFKIQKISSTNNNITSTKNSSNIKNNLALGFQNITPQSSLLNQHHSKQSQQISDVRQNLLGQNNKQNLGSSSTLHQMLSGGIGGLQNSSQNSNQNSQLIAQMQLAQQNDSIIKQLLSGKSKTSINNNSNNGSTFQTNNNLLQQLVLTNKKSTAPVTTSQNSSLNIHNNSNNNNNNTINDQIYLKKWLSNGTFITPMTQQQIRASDTKKSESEHLAQEIENLILILSQNCKSDLEKTVIRAAVMSAHSHNMDTRQILHHVQGQLGTIQALSRNSKDLGQFLASLSAMGISFGQQQIQQPQQHQVVTQQSIQATNTSTNNNNNTNQITISAELFNQLANQKNSSAQMSALAVIRANQQAQQALIEAQKAAENAVVEQVKMQSSSSKNDNLHQNIQSIQNINVEQMTQEDLIAILQKQNKINNKTTTSSTTNNNNNSIQIPGTQIHIPNPQSIQATMEFQKARENINAANLIHNSQLRNLQQKINAQLNGNQAINKETLAEQAMHLLQLHKQQEEIESRTQKEQFEAQLNLAAQNEMGSRGMAGVRQEPPEKFDLSGLKPEGINLYTQRNNSHSQNNNENTNMLIGFKKWLKND